MISKHWPTIKEHLEFNKKEYIDIILASLILSFIFSLSNWDGNINYIAHLILIIIIVIITLVIHLTTQKIFALYNGYKAEFQISVISLLIALMIAFLTEIPTRNFLLVLVIPGTMVYKAMVKHRIGKWPKGPNFGEMAFITSSGPMINIILAVIFYGLYQASSLWGFWIIAVINLFFAFGTILPIPKNDGLQILYASRVGYVVVAALVILTSYFILMKFSFITVLISAIVTILAVWGGYYYFVERKL